MLQQEIQQLSASKHQDQVKQSAVEQRINKLLTQLAKHQDITATKANSINQKLQQLHQQLLFDQWLQTSKQQFKLAWADFLGINRNHLGAWLLKDALIEKFMPIMDFNAQSKKLARQMIKAINQDQFDQFINAKYNQRFLQLMADQGFELSTWPDAVGPLEYRTEEGEMITLAIEHDPLQLLDMGGHFRTCLSPGNFNYFSVFTNIADVNKQVIYARNAQNQVVGRVLIGITNQGALQVFHCYTHHKKYQFNQQVMGYIKTMAEQLGLLISAHGSVTPLSCQQWYDDGARNIHSQYPGLAENAPFRRQLPTMNAASFMGGLKAAIGPRRINALIFTSLLSMPEFKANPQLITSLLKLSTTIDHIPTSDILQLYALCQYANLQKSCFAAHRKRLLKHMRQLIHHWEWFENPHIKTIASHHPSDALRLIKTMAKTQKIDWRTDLTKSFRQAAQVALQQLGRHQLAESMNTS